MDKTRLPFGGGNEIVHTTVVCSHPDASLAIFIDRIDVIIAQAIGVILMMSIPDKTVALRGLRLGLDQAVAFRSYPEVMVAIFGNGIYIA